MSYATVDGRCVSVERLSERASKRGNRRRRSTIASLDHINKSWALERRISNASTRCVCDISIAPWLPPFRSRYFAICALQTWEFRYLSFNLSLEWCCRRYLPPLCRMGNWHFVAVAMAAITGRRAHKTQSLLFRINPNRNQSAYNWKGHTRVPRANH